MNRTEFQDRISYCRRELEWLQGIPMNCTTCEHKELGKTWCKKYGAIPDEFVQIGCDEWVFDEVPF